MKKFLDAYYTLLKWALTLLMLALIVPVTIQILARFVDSIPRYIWTEELARFCFIWIILVGSMLAMRDNEHFSVDLLPAAKSQIGKAISVFFVDIMCLLLAIIFVVWGWPLVKFGLLQTSEMADLPMVYIYMAWPITGITWVLFITERMFSNYQKLRVGGL